MGLYELSRQLEKLEGLDKIGDPLAEFVPKLFPPGPVKDLLSGTWLGHSLHPLLTDVPIGTWLSATMLDLVGGEESRDASEKLIAIGLLASLPTAAAGLSDWSDTMGGERRMGVMHAASNTASLLLFGASLAARRRGRHGLGVALSLVATGTNSLGAYLGGHLSLVQGVGVDQTAFEEDPEEWTAVLPETKMPEGEAVKVDVGGTGILLFRSGDRIHALANRCNHLSGPLDEGEIDGLTVTCPWHASCFRLEDGSVVRGPARSPQPAYATRIREGQIEVGARTN
ncbi:MAG: Rieske 2Fe-2S domain-containing protein [Actinobacteria bacterium]|nr:Rieske 2Fe-2S domain-containing protein [Actinomycetota bacterium]MDQ3531014.1 Rieske 2Fe-2S domain-containing protein [Actinomycetota bacterium]